MRKSAAIIVGGVVLTLMLVLLRNQIPTLIGSKDVAEEGQSADIDFPVVLRVKGGMLEVASIKGRKAFPKATDHTLLGQSIPYCREKASWEVPYKITYRLKLGTQWPLRYRNGTLYARVPELEPSLPVAIDTEKLTRGAEESCWFLPNLGTRERALKSITPQLNAIARSGSAKKHAREAARQTVIEFLRTWAFNQRDYPKLSPGAKIVVMFPGE